MNKHKGMTLIELMITLMIIAIVLSLAVMTLRGYIPKQRLISSVGYLENLTQQAQTEANARSYWTCIGFTSSNPMTAQIFVDVSGLHGATGACSATSGNIALTSVALKENVQFASGGNCSGINVTNSCKIWFDTTGAPKICANSGSCGGTVSAPASGCIDNTFQIVLSSSDLDAGAKARELELLSGGLIQTVKPGDKGLATTLWANNPTIASAAGECE